MSSVRLSGLSSSMSRRAVSIHGSAPTRMSYASNGLRSGFDLGDALGGAGGAGAGFSVSTNEKATMQNLNDRLASYLSKVRELETKNAKLEQQIREWYDKQTPTVRDYSAHQVTINDLRSKICSAVQTNAVLMLQIDNAKLAAEDFKLKYENELALCQSVEVDIVGLRKVLDELTMTRSDLEMQVEGLKEELVYLRKNHEEEMAAMRSVITASSVNVEVDAKPQQDLNHVLEEVRSQYEGIVSKNRKEVEAWYKVKFEELNKRTSAEADQLNTSRSEINELKRVLQDLEIQLQSELSRKNAVEMQLSEVEVRYSDQLRQLQCRVDSLQEELNRLRTETTQQSMEFQRLLDIKTRLEMEIAEYRRLLGGYEEQTVTVKEVKTVKKEEEKHKPVVSQRTVVVIEELVDGKVVSTKEIIQP
ncbi:keratin 97 [Oryzias melastigma]|uniref:Keratin 97 n=1 Tax=Oryzias melastigma TaxID=30732 RepID=A0A3B3CKT3_ORYME|nr:keratin 97 [Oryzias melastigma]